MSKKHKNKDKTPKDLHSNPQTLKQTKIYPYILFNIIVIFGFLATLVGESGAVGVLGEQLGVLNIRIFGYVGYVYLPLLLYPAYCLYKTPYVTFHQLELIVASLLGFVSVLLGQSLLLGVGDFGNSVVHFLRDFIGDFGIWVLVLGSLLLAFFVGTQSSVDSLVRVLNPYIKPIFTTIFEITNAICAEIKGCFVLLGRGAKKCIMLLGGGFLTIKTKSKEQVLQAYENYKINALEKKQQEQEVEEERIRHLQGIQNLRLDDNEPRESYAQHLQSPQHNVPNPPTSQQETPYNNPQDSQIYLNKEEQDKEGITFELLEASGEDPKQFLQEQIAQYQQKNTPQVVPIPKNAQEFSDIVIREMQNGRLHNDEIKQSPKDITPNEQTTQELYTPTIDTNKMQSSNMGLGSLFATKAQNEVQGIMEITQPLDIASIIAPQDSLARQAREREAQKQAKDNAPTAPLSPNTPNEQTQQVTPLIKSTQELPPIQDVAIKEIGVDRQPEEKIPLKAIEGTPPPPPKKPERVAIKELAENQRLLKDLERGGNAAPLNYKLPTTSLLNKPDGVKNHIDDGEIDTKSQILLEKLKTFKIDGDVVRFYTGPIVTTFEFRPAPNVKVSRILNLEDDLALALSAKSIRIQAPVPGKDVVGIEIPNNKIETIYLREVLESDLFKSTLSPLTLAFGKDIVGNPFVQDLRKLPHLLIAGTTGAGKSVGLNAMILSLLYKNSPDNLKLMMIDPKRVEFSLYSDIPHLITPIITDPRKAIAGLVSAVGEMDRRYEMMKESRVKDYEGYNKRAKEEGRQEMPYLIVVIDELADLMQTAGREAEAPLGRIAQMGRACGIHLIIATQRPSVDVVTGTLKGNLPSRISYKVGSKVDSKVVLDSTGAESLLGRGDMLFKISDSMIRLHAPLSTEEEIERVVDFIKQQRDVEYDESFLLDKKESVLAGSDESDEEDGEILGQIKRFMLESNSTSISAVQRKFSIGYNKAAKFVEELEKEGFLSKPNHKGVRDIL